MVLSLQPSLSTNHDLSLAILVPCSLGAVQYEVFPVHKVILQWTGHQCLHGGYAKTLQVDSRAYNLRILHVKGDPALSAVGDLRPREDSGDEWALLHRDRLEGWIDAQKALKGYVACRPRFAHVPSSARKAVVHKV